MHGVPDSGLKAKFDVSVTNVLSPSIKEQKTLYKGQDDLNTIIVELHTLQSWWALSPSQRAGFSLPVTPSIQPEKRTPNLSVIKSWKFQFMLQCIHVNFIYITEQYSYYHVTSAFSSTFSNCQSICADDFLCMIVDVSCIPATTSLGISILFLNRNPQMKLK